MDRGGSHHLYVEHSFVIVHPLHSWKLYLKHTQLHNHRYIRVTRILLTSRPKTKMPQNRHSYIRGEDGVAGWGFLHRHRQAEGSGAQAAVLHQRNPLWRRAQSLKARAKRYVGSCGHEKVLEEKKKKKERALTV